MVLIMALQIAEPQIEIGDLIIHPSKRTEGAWCVQSNGPDHYHLTTFFGDSPKKRAIKYAEWITDSHLSR